jgi:hypothetical protein
MHRRLLALNGSQSVPFFVRFMGFMGFMGFPSAVA